MGGTRRSWGKIQKKRQRFYPSYVHPEDPMKTRHQPVGGFTTKMDAEAWLAAEHRAIELGGGWPLRNVELKPRQNRSPFANGWVSIIGSSSDRHTKLLSPLFSNINE